MDEPTTIRISADTAELCMQLITQVTLSAAADDFLTSAQQVSAAKAELMAGIHAARVDHQHAHGNEG